MSDVPSKSQVKRAGSRIRRVMRGDETDLETFNAAVRTIETWRRAHANPLVTAHNGLRSRARTCGVEAQVSQRLKRRQTILEKLLREPTLDLSRMQDIGGCRAVVHSMDDLRRLEDRICTGQLPVLSRSDYIESPRVSGYRGVHIVVSYNDRAIEIQLRTGVMHGWAVTAEAFSSLVGQNLKQDGSHPIQLFLRSASEIMALEEFNQEVPEDLLNLHAERRLAVQPLLKGAIT